jgi:hypothetical protein
MAETNVSLAISLHAATEELRGRLMPVNRKYSLQQLMDCCRNLPLPRRKRITFEYVLLSGVNDSLADANALCRVLRGVPSKVNVIPFNPHPESQFERPTDEAVKRFQQVLFDHKIQVNVRRPRGDDIALPAALQASGRAGPFIGTDRGLLVGHHGTTNDRCHRRQRIVSNGRTRGSAASRGQDAFRNAFRQTCQGAYRRSGNGLFAAPWDRPPLVAD